MSEVIEKLEEIQRLAFEKVNANNAEITSLKDRIEQLEAGKDIPRGSAANDSQEEIAERKAYLDYLRDNNPEGLTKSVNVGTGSAGGYTVPSVIDTNIEREMKSGTPWLDLCTVVSNATVGYRHLVSDRSFASSTSSETGSRSETNPMLFIERTPTYGEIYAYPKVTNWALQDSQFNIEQLLNIEVGDEFAYQVDSQVVSGSGTNAMTGFVTATPESNGDDSSPVRTDGVFQYIASGASSSIPHAPSSSPVSYGPDALIDLIKALRAPYRKNASFVMNSNTLAEIMKWRDVDGRGYIAYDLTTGAPTNLLGYPLNISESMQDIGTNAFPIGFGDWKRAYLIVKYGPAMTVVTDPYTAKGFTSIYYAQRYGGKILNDQAAKLLKCATS